MLQYSWSRGESDQGYVQQRQGPLRPKATSLWTQECCTGHENEPSPFHDVLARSDLPATSRTHSKRVRFNYIFCVRAGAHEFESVANLLHFSSLYFTTAVHLGIKHALKVSVREVSVRWSHGEPCFLLSARKRFPQCFKSSRLEST